MDESVARDQTPLELKNRSLTGWSLLRTAIRCYLRRPFLFSGILAAYAGLGLLVVHTTSALLFNMFLPPFGASSKTSELHPPEFSSSFQIGIGVLWLVASLLVFVLYGVAQGGIAAAEDDISAARAPTVHGVLSMLRCKFWKTIGAMAFYLGILAMIPLGVSVLWLVFVTLLPSQAPALAFLTGVIGFLLAMIAGWGLLFYFRIRYLFTPIATARENLRPFEALSRSSSLSQGKWWRTFGLYLTVSLSMEIAIIILNTLIGIGLEFLLSRSAAEAVIAALLYTVVNLTLGPIVLIGVSLIYSDLLGQRADPCAEQSIGDARPSPA